METKSFFPFLRTILFDYCVDQNYIKDPKQIVDVRGKSFEEDVNHQDCIRIMLQKAGQITMSVMNNDKKATKWRHFTYDMKYSGENAFNKLNDILSKLENKFETERKLATQKIVIVKIDDIQNVSVVFDGSFYEQANVEITFLWQDETQL